MITRDDCFLIVKSSKLSLNDLGSVFIQLSKLSPHIIAMRAIDVFQSSNKPGSVVSASIIYG